MDKQGLCFSETDPFTGNKRNYLSSTFCIGKVQRLDLPMLKSPSIYKRQRTSKGVKTRSLEFKNIFYASRKPGNDFSKPKLKDMFYFNLKGKNVTSELKTST